MNEAHNDIIHISSVKFLAVCAALAGALFLLSPAGGYSSTIIAAEVLTTILALFLFGSIKYRIDKNALTYGAVIVIAASFFPGWWGPSALRAQMAVEGTSALWAFVHRYAFTLHGLDHLVHADTMLFILGLTFFVAVIAQTRILETASFTVLQKTGGKLVPTVAALTAIVAVASGVLDGVSMIGLMIRTLVILLFLAKAEDDSVIYAVMVSTIVTTVCGMWLAYGEPPNLIMKANLHPHLDNAFFLRYCLPAAVGSYLIVFWNLRKKLKGKTVNLKKLDLLDQHTADVRFLQVLKHGETLTPVEFAEAHRDQIGSHMPALLNRLHQGVPLGEALVIEHLPRDKRLPLLGKYLSEDLAETLDDYYVHVFGKNDHKADQSAVHLSQRLEKVRQERVAAQRIGGMAFLPFIGLLIVHAFNHDVPLFLASMAGFAVAFFGIARKTNMRRLALREARHEFKEYLFLLPLFLSIALLQKTGFFEQVSALLHTGIERWGTAPVAWSQFAAATFLSALLDNNIVADFASHALHNLPIAVLHLFAMAQIAGYALGGCWTHIGSAQSVVAYAFIQKEVNPRYTPFQWIKAMTPVIVEVAVFLSIVVFVESKLLSWLY